MVTIKLSNKLYYSLITIAIILLISAGVYAWTAGGTGNPGHSIQDVAAPTSCTQGQYLRLETSDYVCPTYYGVDAPCWVCATPSTFTPGYSFQTISGHVYCVGPAATFNLPSGWTSENTHLLSAKIKIPSNSWQFIYDAGIIGDSSDGPSGAVSLSSSNQLVVYCDHIPSTDSTNFMAVIMSFS